MNSSSAANIALCITDLEPGGAERTLVELAIRLDRALFNPGVFCLAARPPRDDVLPRKLVAAEIPVHFMDAGPLRSAPRVYRRLRKEFAEFRPAIVQTMLWHANTLGTIAARRAQIPHILTGIRVVEPRPGRHWWTRRVDRFVDRHVCVSQSVAEYTAKKVRIARDKLVVIPNGIAAERYPQDPLDLTELGLLPGRRALAFVGRLDEQKRSEWLLRRMPEILARLPTHDLIMVGHGPLHGSLLRLVDRLNLAGRIHFVGWRNDVPAILAASDLLLLTSAHEGMPNVVLEAMASGIPVVSTRSEGIDELLGDDVHQVVDQGDAHDFVRRVSHLGPDRELCRQIGAANRQRAVAQFSIERMVAKYADLYQTLLDIPPA